MLLFLPEETGEKPWFFRLIRMTLTLLAFGNPTHNLVDVLSTSSPGCFAALSAGCFLTHVY